MTVACSSIINLAKKKKGNQISPFKMIGRGRDMIEKLELKSLILFSHMLPFKIKELKRNK
jgi:hypothetical protein